MDAIRITLIHDPSRFAIVMTLLVLDLHGPEVVGTLSQAVQNAALGQNLAGFDQQTSPSALLALAATGLVYAAAAARSAAAGPPRLKRPRLKRRPSSHNPAC